MDRNGEKSNYLAEINLVPNLCQGEIGPLLLLLLLLCEVLFVFAIVVEVVVQQFGQMLIKWSTDHKMIQGLTWLQRTRRNGTPWKKEKKPEREIFFLFRTVAGLTGNARYRIDHIGIPVDDLRTNCAPRRAILEQICESQWCWSEIELFRFVTVLFARGAFCPNTPWDDCWSRVYGCPLIRDLMTKDRFRLIKKWLIRWQRSSTAIVSRRYVWADSKRLGPVRHEFPSKLQASKVFESRRAIVSDEK